MVKAKLDKADRIVIPKPYCKVLNIGEGSVLNISFEKGAVVIRPEDTICKICGKVVTTKRTISLCDNCLKEAHNCKI